jgi:stress response protein YsnF
MDAPYDIYDYEVLDRDGRRLGKITGYWVDEATSTPEFAAVKTGWLFGKNHVLPIRDAYFDHAGRALRVPYEEQTIRDAPSFDAEHVLSPDEEERVYSHYRLERSHARSSTGLPERGGAARGPAQRTAEIPLHEERVDVSKRQVDTGAVRLRKVVRTEAKEVPIELRRERVEIERIPAKELRGTYTGRAFIEDEITMRERREEPVIHKTREVVGGVRATKDVDTRRENVRADVRREDVEVDRPKMGEGLRDRED